MKEQDPWTRGMVRIPVRLLNPLRVVIDGWIRSLLMLPPDDPAFDVPAPGTGERHAAKAQGLANLCEWSRKARL